MVLHLQGLGLGVEIVLIHHALDREGEEKSHHPHQEQDLEGGERYHQQEQVQAGINTEIVETEAVPLQESRTRQTVANLLMVKNRQSSVNVPSSGKNLLLAEIVPRIGRQPLGIDHQLARNGPGTGLLVKGKINKVDLGTAEILTPVTGTTEEVLRMIETTGDPAKTIVTIAVSKMIVTTEVGRMTYVVE